MIVLCRLDTGFLGLFVVVWVACTVEGRAATRLAAPPAVRKVRRDGMIRFSAIEFGEVAASITCMFQDAKVFLDWDLTREPPKKP